jgi:hypothetical protein
MRAPAETFTSFRTRELNQLLAILARRGAAVIVVRGAPGMGKSMLLRDLRGAALVHGWAVGGGGQEAPVSVGPRTTDLTFLEEVLASAELVADGGAAVSIRQPRAVKNLVFQELVRRTPLVVIVDEYRPSEEFAQWFERDFVSLVRDCTVPLVLALPQPPGGSRIEKLATDVIPLEELDAGMVLAVLQELAPRLQPAPTADELDRYADEVRTPEVLDSLVRVLSLATAPDTRP